MLLGKVMGMGFNTLNASAFAVMALKLYLPLIVVQSVNYFNVVLLRLIGDILFD